MCDWYEAEGGREGESTLDELLCEYVDGTMDPAVREVFEEVLEADPDLADEVRALCCTRELLCHYSCHQPVSLELEARFRQRLNSALARETMREQTPVLAATTAHLATLATVVSAAALTLTLSLCVAAVQLGEETAAQRSAVPAAAFYHPAPHSAAHTLSPLRFDHSAASDRVSLLPTSMMERPYDVAFLQRSANLLDAQP